MSTETQIKRICHRDWTEILDAWLAHLGPLSISPPGSPPDEGLVDNFALGSVFKKVVPPQIELRTPAIPGLNATMLHEGIYLVHKAANVLVAAQNQIAQGLPTWSIPTAYQSAFFSMEAMLQILGVAITEIDNKSMIVDIWPSVDAKASRQLKNSYQIGSEIHLLPVSRIDHHHRWAVLKRVLRMLSNSPISGKIINTIDAVDDKQFARPRNRLHYRTTWIFTDLHSFCSDVAYCRFTSAQSLLDHLDQEDNDFTVTLAYLLLAGNIALLSSLGNVSPLIASEVRLLNDACCTERMPFRNSCEEAMSVPLFV